MAKLTVNDLGKTFRTTGKFAWLAGLQDDGTDDEAGGESTRAWHKREVTAFSNVSFSLEAGEALGILGPGRTSLLRVIAGLTAPTSGYVTGQGSVVYMNGLRQAPYPKLSLRTNLEAVTELAIGRRVDRRRRDASIAKAADVLDMHPRLDTAAYWFHPNQYGSLAFATIIAFRPEIMLFDEILHPGEPEATEWIISELRQHLSGGGIVIVASRRPYLARTFSANVYDLGSSDFEDSDELVQAPEPTFVETLPPSAPSYMDAPVPAGTDRRIAVKAARPAPVDLHASTDGYFRAGHAPVGFQDTGQWQDISAFASPPEEPGRVAQNAAPDETVVGAAGREILSEVPGLGLLRAVRTRTPAGRAVNQVGPGEPVVVDVYFDVLEEAVGVDIVAAFSVALLNPNRTKMLTPPNKVALARLPAALSCSKRGSYLASCHFDGQLTQAMALTYLVTADISMTFWDEGAGERPKATHRQILDAQLHWIVRSDWSGNIPFGYYGAAPMRVAALFPALRWDVKYDVDGSAEPTDSGMEETR